MLERVYKEAATLFYDCLCVFYFPCLVTFLRSDLHDRMEGLERELITGSICILGIQMIMNVIRSH